jgi:hypothetical protein
MQLVPYSYANPQLPAGCVHLTNSGEQTLQFGGEFVLTILQPQQRNGRQTNPGE